MTDVEFDEGPPRPAKPAAAAPAAAPSPSGADAFEIDDGPPRSAKPAAAAPPSPPPRSPAAAASAGRAAAPAPSAPAMAWSFADAIVTHNQDMHGIRLFFGFAAASAWLLAYGVPRLLAGLFIGDGPLVWLLPTAAVGVLAWYAWSMLAGWRGATAARRIAYGLPSADAPAERPPEIAHAGARALLTPARWTVRAWAAHHERIVLDPAGVEEGEAAVARLGRSGDDGLAIAETGARPAVLDALELLGIGERIPGAAPTRIRLRAQVRQRLFPPKKEQAAQNALFANVRR